MASKNAKLKGYDGEYCIINYDTCKVEAYGEFKKKPTRELKASLKDYAAILLAQEGLTEGRYIVQLGKKDMHQIASYFMRDGAIDENHIYSSIEWMAGRVDYPSRIIYGKEYSTPNKDCWMPELTQYRKRKQVAKDGTVIRSSEVHDFRGNGNYMSHMVTEYMEKNYIESINDLNEKDYQLIMIQYGIFNR